MPALPKSKAALQERWEPHKELLEKLFLKEKKTLKELGKLMADSYNFEATESQYEYIFREWGFEKNLKGSDWVAIEYHTSKRKREGKENEVLHNGIALPTKKVRKEIRRNKRISSLIGNRVTTPKLPKGVIIRTPRASPTISTAVPGWFKTTSMMPRESTMLQFDIPASSPFASRYSSGQVSEFVGQQFWSEFCDTGGLFVPKTDYNLRCPGHVISSLQRSTDEFVASPQQHPTTQGFNEFLLAQEMDMTQQKFTFLNDPESRPTAWGIMAPGWSDTPPGQLDNMRSAFNATSTMKQNTFFVSNWGGKHSKILNNIPWFQFQHLAAGSIYSSGTPSNHGNAFYSPVDRAENLQIEHAISTEDRQRLLHGLFHSETASNSLQKPPLFKSILKDAIPERFEGDIENRLQSFIDPLNQWSLFELAQLHLYLLANAILTEEQKDEFLSIIIVELITYPFSYYFSYFSYFSF